MKLALGIFAAMLAVSTTSVAAPFLVCDPYSTNAAEAALPTEFVVTFSGITEPVITPAIPVGPNQIGMKLDLGPLNLSGRRTVTAKARNVWGQSNDSAPLAFTAGPPQGPSGLGLTAQ